MKNVFRRCMFFCCAFLMALCMGTAVKADDVTIKEGVFADQDSLYGMTEQEADAFIRDRIAEMGKSQITLIAANGNEVKIKAEDLGITWANPELVQEAISLGTEGNVIQRYKALKDLQFENRTFEVKWKFEWNAINHVLVDQCVKYDQIPKDAQMTRVDGEFQITEGSTGYELDIESSIDVIYDYLVNSWDGKDCRIPLVVMEERPRGTAEDLAEVKDLLGTFTTEYSSANANRAGNVKNGCEKINGTILYPGEEFSATKTVSPFTTENGYALAGAYLNGRVVDSVGGGICQVSSTLYNAVLLAELEVTERNPHSMTVTYVDPAADAAIAEASGKDFKFRNNLDYPIYIEGYVTKNKKITFNVYGKETRPENRTVRYESEILETTEPTVDIITADATKPLGYVTSEAAHLGCKSRLWKIVSVDGREVSREIVNNSKYTVSPRRATVGVITDAEWKYVEIMAAIGTNDLDHVKVVIDILLQSQTNQ